MFSKEDLKGVFQRARESNAPYVFIEVSIPGASAGEMIINKSENFDFKENFYLMSYNDKLEHHHNNNIKIIGMSYGDLDELRNIYWNNKNIVLCGGNIWK